MIEMGIDYHLSIVESGAFSSSNNLNDTCCRKICLALSEKQEVCYNNNFIYYIIKYTYKYSLCVRST